ncbi:F-box protein At1g61340-like [Lotus japonicus]|uniref:F-box protein At1g61340-like n=1 Tax=Lotus japonicus TaxID=34305 RepID=UPI00258C1307|nr:F-box protein At1g61340-like [Lotus japonicus]
MAIGCVGRRRVLIPNNDEASPPLKRFICSHGNSESSSPLEALPQEILIKVLCGVDHEDLKQLFHVSKTIREATLVAKEMHFEFSTPKKKTFALISPVDMEEEIEAPNAPLPLKNPKSRLQGRKLSSLALFASMDEEQ